MANFNELNSIVNTIRDLYEDIFRGIKYLDEYSDLDSDLKDSINDNIKTSKRLLAFYLKRKRELLNQVLGSRLNEYD